MNIENDIERVKNLWMNTDNPYYVEALKSALDALIEKAARLNPKPLTPDELKERVGKPVFITYNWATNGEWVKRGWYVPEKHDMKSAFFDGYTWNNYGKTWLAYDHEPQEEV